MAASAIRHLEQICSGHVVCGVPLSRISRWRIGGLADVIVRPRNIEELARLRVWLHSEGLAHVVIGATSNLLFADEGLRVICLQIGGDFASLSVAGCEITAGPGCWVPGLARRAMQAGLTGLEHTCGIPGTLGGLICMNGGSQRKGIGDAIVSVTSVDAQGNVRHRTREECAFAYRQSVFQTCGDVIAGAVLRLRPTPDRALVRREMLEILGSRRRKFPQKQPNCGSVFVSNPAMYGEYGPPGAVIQRLGFKGRRLGGALVSAQHANFIVNAGGATAGDVLSLIKEINSAVLTATGYAMEVEARYVSAHGDILPAGSSLTTRPIWRLHPST
ncbi:MAG TPA: UDP-N-acetylmuramate dehydrogenase [Candidatus Accumulibacter phosphatis]|nr:UDP-N-acetylmuramate dehydrogenase [Candidatus Accumulibacter phosphatis]